MSFTVVYKIVFDVKLNFMYSLTRAFCYHSIHRLPKKCKILKGHEKCDKDLNIAEKPEEQLPRFFSDTTLNIVILSIIIKIMSHNYLVCIQSCFKIIRVPFPLLASANPVHVRQGCVASFSEKNYSSIHNVLYISSIASDPNL